MEEYTCAAFSEEHLGSYKQFAKRNFGKSSYQSSEAYLYWLYKANPASKGYSDLILVLDSNGSVVGCLHCLRLAVDTSPGLPGGTIPVLHNLMVDKEHRVGAGFLLVRRVLQSDRSFLVPGVTGALSETYKKLGAQSLPSRWLSKWAMPMPRALPTAFRAVTKPEFTFRGRLRTRSYDIRSCRISVHTNYSKPEFDRLLSHIGTHRLPHQPVWSEASLRWRLFSYFGPPCVLLMDDSLDSALILSFGVRHRLPIARILFSHAPDDARHAAILAAALKYSSEMSAAMVLSTVSNERLARFYCGAGFHRTGNQPDTYLWLRRKEQLEATELDILGTDIGFEGIPNEV